MGKYGIIPNEILDVFWGDRPQKGGFPQVEEMDSPLYVDLALRMDGPLPK